MNEIDRMRSGLLADMSKPELQESFIHAKKLLAKMRTMSTYDRGYRELLEDLVPGIPSTSVICPPFHCDHGHGIRLGEHVFINANCTFLDGAFITIGAHTLIGPDVRIYTPHHPMDYIDRRENREYAYPVTIGEDCWIGGGAVICPGVTIGSRSVVGAGSVVTKDVPPDTLVAGNPARIIRRIPTPPECAVRDDDNEGEIVQLGLDSCGD
ncbi:MAG: sugar O-acetyltransferase [Duncaniella sp.]|nr:sugar O-acetyltransferase [Duncaniella sp.]